MFMQLNPGIKQLWCYLFQIFQSISFLETSIWHFWSFDEPSGPIKISGGKERTGQHSLSLSLSLKIWKKSEEQKWKSKKSFKVPSRKWETMFSHIDDDLDSFVFSRIVTHLSIRLGLDWHPISNGTVEHIFEEKKIEEQSKSVKFLTFQETVKGGWTFPSSFFLLKIFFWRISTIYVFCILAKQTERKNSSE